MSWLGNGFQDKAKALADAYASMYAQPEETDAETISEAYQQVDENRRAARNPESQSSDKKYDRVRGEKTPMPPRGDKRREDFEKWYAKNVREESEDGMEIIDEYSVSVEDGIHLEEGKKKCKEGYKYDSDKKKCVKKKKKSSSSKSSKTTIIVGRGYGYGGGHHHHDDDGDKETPTGGSGGGGDAGGDGGGDGGGGGE